MATMPTMARERVDRADLRGRLAAIQVRPRRREPTVAVEAWDLSTEADHARSDKRAVTLFQAEHLPVIEAILGRPVDFARTRRNLMIEGLNLNVAKGRQVVVGEVVLELTEICHPCARMEEAFGLGGFAAMYGYGGWCARIVQAGTLRVGDEVRLHLDGDLA